MTEELRAETAAVLMRALPVTADEIVEVSALKKGMTNRSFLVTCRGEKYIVRLPGEGTEKLINRGGEAASYQAIAGKEIGDEILYIDPGKGYKITRFWEGARCCDAGNDKDVALCMNKLRTFHETGLAVSHEFDIFGQIEFYEKLREGKSSAYQDYWETKERVLSLRPYIEEHIEKKVLTHIDAVPDNFLFLQDKSGKEQIRLIDWEYAGMQDPHVDLAMFVIYSFYDRRQADRLMDAYFTVGCSKETRIKIYAYMAACGLLWSNWCEYKHSLGVAFGEYALRQYRYAADYSRIVQDAWKR